MPLFAKIAAVALALSLTCGVAAQSEPASAEGWPPKLAEPFTTESGLTTSLPAAEDHRGHDTTPSGQKAAGAPRQIAAPPESGYPALVPPSRSGQTSSSAFGGFPGGSASMVAVAGSLGIVLGLFCLMVWLMKRATPYGQRGLPTDVIESLGHAPLAARQQMHLLRCGGKLLLVSVTPEATETLTEITDPDEVARLVSLCRRDQPGSATATFRQLLDQFGRTPADADANSSYAAGGQGRIDA